MLRRLHRWLAVLLVAMMFTTIPLLLLIHGRFLRNFILVISAVFLVALWTFAAVDHLLYRAELREHRPS